MLYIKALHIVFVVTWFSGMFYLVRLFIYNREAQDKSTQEKEILSKQYCIMIPRLLFGITLPSAVLTLIFGLSLLSYYHSIPAWLWMKFSFLIPLFAYHVSLHFIWDQQKKGNYKYSSNALRVWNEVATLFLIAIVFAAVVKDTMSFAYGLVGLIAIGGILMLAIKMYRKIRSHTN
jgi:putative membrane protein